MAGAALSSSADGGAALSGGRPASYPATTISTAPGAALDSEEPRTIFVSVASYRDPEALFTIRSIFERAAFPSRVIVGVCFQCDELVDADCYDLSALRPSGCAMYARFGFRGRRLVGQSGHGTSSSNGYLTTRPTSYKSTRTHALRRIGMRCSSRCLVAVRAASQCSQPTHCHMKEQVTALDHRRKRLTVLCTRVASEAFGSDRMLRFHRLLSKRPAAPLPTPFWAAGFSFSSGRLVREVPYDPHLLPLLWRGDLHRGAHVDTRLGPVRP